MVCMNAHIKVPDDLLTRQQVAEHFKVCTRTIGLWERRGMLLAIRINSRVIRYRKEDVEKVVIPHYPPIASPA
jgi:predicted site-specific integrase-resolvase